LSPFHWLQNTWPWMTSNGHFAFNSVLRRYVWSSEVWLSKLGYTLKLVVNVVGELSWTFKLKKVNVLQSRIGHHALITLKICHGHHVSPRTAGTAGRPVGGRFHNVSWCPMDCTTDCHGPPQWHRWDVQDWYASTRLAFFRPCITGALFWAKIGRYFVNSDFSVTVIGRLYYNRWTVSCFIIIGWWIKMYI